MNKLTQKKQTSSVKKGASPYLHPTEAGPFESFDSAAEIDWSEEIKALSNLRFETLEAAVDALCAKVIEKLTTQEDAEHTRAFLKGIILDNKEFCAVIRDSLQVEK